MHVQLNYFSNVKLGISSFSEIVLHILLPLVAYQRSQVMQKAPKILTAEKAIIIIINTSNMAHRYNYLSEAYVGDVAKNDFKQCDTKILSIVRLNLINCMTAANASSHTQRGWSNEYGKATQFCYFQIVTHKMALNLQRITSISQHRKDVVIGYNRQIKNNIPKSISHLCLLFYHEYDYFMKCGRALIINDRYDTVTSIDKNKGTFVNHSILAHGSVSIDCSGNNKEALSTIYSWTFQLIAKECVRSGVGIGLYSYSRRCYFSGQYEGFRVGMLLKFEFNPKNETICVARNGSKGTEFHWKTEGDTYHIAIVFDTKGTTVKLNKFEKKSCV